MKTVLSTVEGSMEFDREKLQRDFNFEEWMKLSDAEKRYIYKHVWNPIRPEIGAQTRQEIIERFKRTLSIPEEDIVKLYYGYFGAFVGAIHIVVTKPHYKVPSHFAWLPVNRGVCNGERIRWRWTL